MIFTKQMRQAEVFELVFAYRSWIYNTVASKHHDLMMKYYNNLMGFFAHARDTHITLEGSCKIYENIKILWNINLFVLKRICTPVS